MGEPKIVVMKRQGQIAWRSKSLVLHTMPSNCRFTSMRLVSNLHAHNNWFNELEAGPEMTQSATFYSLSVDVGLHTLSGVVLKSHPQGHFVDMSAKKSEESNHHETHSPSKSTTTDKKMYYTRHMFDIPHGVGRAFVRWANVNSSSSRPRGLISLPLSWDRFPPFGHGWIGVRLLSCWAHLWPEYWSLFDMTLSQVPCLYGVFTYTAIE